MLRDNLHWCQTNLQPAVVVVVVVVIVLVVSGPCSHTKQQWAPVLFSYDVIVSKLVHIENGALKISTIFIRRFR